jgi:hypothetical protein
MNWRRRALIGALALVSIALAWFALVELPEIRARGLPAEIDPIQRAQMANEYRRTNWQMVAGSVLLWGLWLTHRRIRAMEKQARVAEEGQVTDRFAKAIEHLGNEQMPVRLGGIYSLERIAKDSPRDHPAVMEVMCALLRHYKPSERGPTYMPPADIQAAATVVARRDPSLDAGFRVNLYGAYLRNVTLNHARLDYADLCNATLTNANVYSATLRHAALQGAQCDYTRFGWADLREARFARANLRSSYFFEADLRGAAFHDPVDQPKGPDLTGAKLEKANLAGTDLTYAHGLTREQLAAAQTDASTATPIAFEARPGPEED